MSSSSARPMSWLYVTCAATAVVRNESKANYHTGQHGKCLSRDEAYKGKNHRLSADLIIRHRRYAGDYLQNSNAYGDKVRDV